MNKVKWYVCFIMFLLIAAPQISVAQDTHVFKLGINKLFSKQYFIAYEFKCFKSFSINTELGFLGKAYYMETVDTQKPIGEIRTNQTKHSPTIRHRTNVKSGFQLNTELRYRPGKDLKEGLYVGVKTGYQYADFGPLEIGLYQSEVFDSPSYTKEITAIQRSWLMGGTLGFNLKMTKKLSLDVNLFSGYVYIEQLTPQKLDFIPYTDPTHNEFRNNHFQPIDQFRLELNIFLGF